MLVPGTHPSSLHISHMQHPVKVAGRVATLPTELAQTTCTEYGLVPAIRSLHSHPRTSILHEVSLYKADTHVQIIVANLSLLRCTRLTE